MKKLIVALTIPTFALLSLALYNQFHIQTATEYEFEIEGYDPRDLLAGHYLNFRIKYGIEIPCDKYNRQEMNVCVKPTFAATLGRIPKSCEKWIAGECNGGVFQDNLTRFYVTESRAGLIEARVRTGKATVKIAVAKGNAIIRDLLIDGKSWKEIQ